MSQPEWTTKPEGLVGRVTGRVAPGTVGEILVGIRGGREAFYAYPWDDKETIEEGEEALVIQYKPPRTVYVSRYE